MTLDLLLAVGALAAASFACRAGGFMMMRFVRVTPRMEAALRAVPLGVMIGIVAPAATAGKWAELAALVVVVLAMKMRGNELLASLAGLAAVAAGRWLGL